jgi:hypothetical protein
MTTSPRLGFTDLEEGETVPEVVVNENARILEQMSNRAIATDRLTTPPGSPVDGRTYLIIATATGAWAGKENQLALRVGSAWHYVTPIEGTRCFVQTENVDYEYTGSAWNKMGQEWAVNFTSDGDAYIPVLFATVIAQGNAQIGTGTLTYEKSTAGAPGTFSSTTLPATLEAGAWLKVIASGVTGFVATHLRRAS